MSKNKIIYVLTTYITAIILYLPYAHQALLRQDTKANLISKNGNVFCGILASDQQ